MVKQNLRIKRFYGTSENAVKTQIWIAVSAYVRIAVCVIHAMSVHGFTACRSRISEHVGQGFHGMSVQRFRACRSSS